MKLTRTLTLSSGAFLVACAATPPVAAPTPTANPGIKPSTPAQPAQPSVPVSAPVPRPGTRTFAYAPGTFAYTLTTDATVAPIVDTTQKRPIPELNQQVSLTITEAGDVQVISPVAGSSSACDQNAAFITLAHEVIPKLPDHLATGDHWRDSTLTSGCRGMIPATTQTISNYVVGSDTTFANTNAVRIGRTDSLSANGEGAEGQHRIIIAATGTSTTDFYVNPVTGQLLGSNGLQTALISVTTSGKLTQFLQHVRESVVLKEAY